MKLNEDKCHHLDARNRYETLWVEIGESRIKESKNEKLLGLIIDRNLKLDDCVFVLRKNSGRKLSAFARFSSYISFEKKKNSFENVCRITIWVLPINLDIPQ